MRKVLAIIHVLALGIWSGTSVLFLAVVAPTVFSHFADLPKQPTPGVEIASKVHSGRMAGDLISRFFPGYFTVQTHCGLLAALTGWLLARRGGKLALIRALLSSLAFVALLVNSQIFYRQASEIRADQYRAFDEGRLEDFARMRERFFNWHQPSLAIDVATAGFAVVSLALVGPALHPNGPYRCD
jgi:hypothetical protein